MKTLQIKSNLMPSEPGFRHRCFDGPGQFRDRVSTNLLYTAATPEIILNYLGFNSATELRSAGFCLNQNTSNLRWEVTEANGSC